MVAPRFRWCAVPPHANVLLTPEYWYTPVGSKQNVFVDGPYTADRFASASSEVLQPAER